MKNSICRNGDAIVISSYFKISSNLIGGSNSDSGNAEYPSGETSSSGYGPGVGSFVPGGSGYGGSSGNGGSSDQTNIGSSGGGIDFGGSDSTRPTSVGIDTGASRGVTANGGSVGGSDGGLGSSDSGSSGGRCGGSRSGNIIIETTTFGTRDFSSSKIFLLIFNKYDGLKKYYIIFLVIRSYDLCFNNNCHSRTVI